MIKIKFYPAVLILIQILLTVRIVLPLYFPKACPPGINVCFIGIEMVTMDTNITLEAYLGIPYAKPPIYNLRFKRPVPYDFGIKSDNCTIFLTMADKPECLQYAYQYESEPHGSEDCLYMNIYRPTGQSYDSDVKLPVLIEFADRDFEKGSANSGVYGPEVLLAFREVILVTVNTRLSIFGYYFNTDYRAFSTGNMGLWDHLMALQWVSKYIGGFGGDPTKITVAGEASVSYLILNKEAMSLINNAIIRYSNFISEYNRPWELLNYGVVPEHTFGFNKEAYLRLMLYPGDGNENILKRYHGLDIILLIYNERMKFETFPEFRFKPVVDSQMHIKDPFLWAHPITLWCHNDHTFKKPLLIVRPLAGAFDMLIHVLTAGYDEVNSKDSEDPNDGLTKVTLFESLFLSTDWKTTSQLVQLHKSFYSVADETEIRNLELNEREAIRLVKFLSSGLFDYPLLKMINLRPQSNPPAETVLVKFAHNADNIKSARSQFLASKGFDVELKFFKGDQKLLSCRGDDNVFVYTSPDYNSNPPNKFKSDFQRWTGIIQMFIENGTYTEGDKVQNCVISGTSGGYDFNCEMLNIAIENGYSTFESFQHIYQAYYWDLIVPFEIYDNFFWGFQRGNNYTRRDVAPPPK